MLVDLGRVLLATGAAEGTREQDRRTTLVDGVGVRGPGQRDGARVVAGLVVVLGPQNAEVLDVLPFESAAVEDA